MRIVDRLKRYTSRALAVLAVGLGLAGTITFPAVAGSAGNAKAEVCQGVNLGGGDNCNANSNDLTNVIEVIVNILSVAGAIAAVIMLIIGGFKYITSGGDSSSTASAKNTIIYAIVGLVVIALAQAVVRFVLGRSTA